MAKWTNINESNDKFRLLCDNEYCSLSVANLLKGKIHITTIHGNERHSYTFSNKDMLFVVSQFIKNLSPSDRQSLLNFYRKFDL